MWADRITMAVLLAIILGGFALLVVGNLPEGGSEPVGCHGHRC